MAIIQIHDLVYRYSQGYLALNAVSLEVMEGESVGIVGPNGAGKTTLFLCLSGVLTPRGGTISLAGLDPTKPEEKRRLPTKLGVVFQNPDDQLFNSTVFDDVAFGPLNLGVPKDVIRVRVREALVMVGMSNTEDRVPHHLSGGEKRRIALAGVLAMQPEILLLDEPSMYLDPRGRRELIELINGLRVTKLIAAHDLEMILQTCTRAVILEAGQIVGDGPPRTLFADAELMEKHGLEVPYSLQGEPGREARGNG